VFRHRHIAFGVSRPGGEQHLLIDILHHFHATQPSLQDASRSATRHAIETLPPKNIFCVSIANKNGIPDWTRLLVRFCIAAMRSGSSHTPDRGLLSLTGADGASGASAEGDVSIQGAHGLVGVHGGVGGVEHAPRAVHALGLAAVLGGRVAGRVEAAELVGVRRAVVPGGTGVAIDVSGIRDDGATEGDDGERLEVHDVLELRTAQRTSDTGTQYDGAPQPPVAISPAACPRKAPVRRLPPAQHATLRATCPAVRQHSAPAADSYVS